MPAQAVPTQHIIALASRETAMMDWTQDRAGLYGVFAHTAFAVMHTAIVSIDGRFVTFAAASRYPEPTARIVAGDGSESYAVRFG